jgi:hypothetical protein
MEIKLNKLTRNKLISLFQQENLIANQKAETIALILDANNVYSEDAKIKFSEDLSTLHILEEDKKKK